MAYVGDDTCLKLKLSKKVALDWDFFFLALLRNISHTQRLKDGDSTHFARHPDKPHSRILAKRRKKNKE